MPFTDSAPDTRLRVFVGATLVVTSDKVRYGWGDRLEHAVGALGGPSSRLPRRIDLDEENYQISFDDSRRCRRRRTGGGPVECWGRIFPLEDPITTAPRNEGIGDAELLEAGGICASRADGVWCWPSSRRPDWVVNPRPSLHYPSPFCTFLTGWIDFGGRSIVARCGYDCTNRRIACRDQWSTIDHLGVPHGSDVESHYVYSLSPPAGEIRSIGFDGGATFFVTLMDGSVWCRGYCGGETLDAMGLPHEGFRRVTDLPPARFVQGHVGPTTFARACALLENGTVTCWGDCQAPIGRRCTSQRGRVEVVEAVGGLRNVIELAVGVATTCALTATDEVWCWGRNEAHAVDPTSDELFVREPVRVHLPTRP